MPFLLAFTQQGKRCTQILALNIYEGILSLPPAGIILPPDTYQAIFWYSSVFIVALSRKPAKPDVLLVLIPRKGKFCFLAVFGAYVFYVL